MLRPNQQVVHELPDRQMLMGAAYTPQLSLTSNLQTIEHEWRNFEQRADCTPFQTFAWLSAWQHCVGAPTGVKPVIVLGRHRNGELLFILPLAIERTRFCRRLVFLGYELCDYNAPLLAQEFPDVVLPAKFCAWWEAVQTFLKQTEGCRYDMVFLNKMPKKVGQQINPLATLNVMANPSSAHLSHLGDNWETFYAGRQRAARRRRDRSRRKKLAGGEKLRLVTLEHPTELQNTLKILFDQKSRSFSRMGVPNLFARTGYSDFFITVATDARSLVHVSCLKVEHDHIAAANLGLTYRNCYYQILVSYDDNLAQYAPGIIHLHEVMNFAIERGYKFFDFTIGDEPFKFDWADTVLDLCDYVSASSWSGRIAATSTTSKIRLKRFVKQSPQLFFLATWLRSSLRSVRYGKHQ